MLLMLLLSLELKLPELKLLEENYQYLLKKNNNTLQNQLNSNICLKLKLLTNFSNKMSKLKMILLMLTKLMLTELKKIILITKLMLLIPKHSNLLLIPPILLVLSGTKLTPCLIDSKLNLKKTPNYQKITKSKLPLILLNSKSILLMNNLNLMLMPKKEKLILKNSPLIYKLLQMMKKLPGHYPNYLMKPSKMLKIDLKPLD